MDVGDAEGRQSAEELCKKLLDQWNQTVEYGEYYTDYGHKDHTISSKLWDDLDVSRLILSPFCIYSKSF